MADSDDVKTLPSGFPPAARELDEAVDEQFRMISALTAEVKAGQDRAEQAENPDAKKLPAKKPAAKKPR